MSKFCLDLTDNGSGRPVDAQRLADSLSRIARGQAKQTIADIVSGLRSGHVEVPLDVTPFGADDVVWRCDSLIQDAIHSQVSTADISWFTREWKRQTGWTPLTRMQR